MVRKKLISKLLLLIFISLFLPESSQSATIDGDLNLKKLLEDLNADDLFSRQRAEVEIRNLGTETLKPLSQLLQEPAEQLNVLLESIFRDKLITFLDEIEDDIISLDEEKREIIRLELTLKAQQQQNNPNPEFVERLKNLKERIKERKPEIDQKSALLENLYPVAQGTILKRLEFLHPVIVKFYNVLANEDLKKRFDELVIQPSDTDFHRKRYLLSPYWFWILANNQLRDSKSEAADKEEPEDPGNKNNKKELIGKIHLSVLADVKKLMALHLETTFRDLTSPDFRLRERAEDEFYMLGDLGLDHLRKQKESEPILCERLIDLLDWRIHPRLRERSSMDFSNYKKMNFRERRSHIIQYARTSGRDAIPTLRLVVLDDKREPSIRVKLTAAEQLAGLRDNTGLQILTRKPMPELLKIPEISRDFYILKGLQYQDEEKYELAILEFQKILDESPFNFEGNYRIAFVYLLNKNYKKSIHHFEISRRIRPEDMLTLYNLACAYSLDGQLDKGVDLLEKSINAGFKDANHIDKDPDLNPLRNLPKFRKVFEELKKGEEDPKP